jgi:hypothetical protein
MGVIKEAVAERQRQARKEAEANNAGLRRVNLSQGVKIAERAFDAAERANRVGTTSAYEYVREYTTDLVELNDGQEVAARKIGSYATGIFLPESYSLVTKPEDGYSFVFAELPLANIREVIEYPELNLPADSRWEPLDEATIQAFYAIAGAMQRPQSVHQ